jgi:hypothetical protein
MKITALYDKQGVILAAVPLDDRYDGPVLVPVASDGNKVGTFEVPVSAGESRLDKICTLFRVDARSQRLVDTKDK